MEQFLSEEFLKKYENRKPPFGGNGLGEMVFLRTYTRWIESKKRREHWSEVIERVINYSMSLYQGPADKQELISEAEQLFDLMFNLKIFPSGRSLWMGGTDVSNKYPSAAFNCAFVAIESLQDFVDTFYLLLMGCGVGFSVEKKYINKLPKLRTQFDLMNEPYQYVGKPSQQQKTEITRFHGTVRIIVGDSKEGWIESLKYLLDVLSSNYEIEKIIMNYNYIRPEGTPLKTFGGRAPGPKPLMDMFENMYKIISNLGIRSMEQLKSIDVMDIQNCIAEAVVVGGVRRSSEICLFDIDDEEIINAKHRMWENNSPNFGKTWRAMSNNSIMFKEKPTKILLLDIFEKIKNNGEPGFVNVDAASKRRPNYKGGNPCFEILLDSKGFCNLTTVNISAFVENGELDDAMLQHAVSLITRLGMRQTNVNVELPEWDRIQKRDRLVGVSMTGFMDAVDSCNINVQEIKRLLTNMKYAAVREAKKYAYEMRIPEPLLVTCVKPEGSLSQLPTVSSGLHRSFSPHYIRRVRISAFDPLATMLYNLGYPVYPENGQGDDLQKANIWVFEFPVKTDAQISASEESALDQLSRYIAFQKYYTDHNSSNTIYVGDDEWDDVCDFVLKNWDDYIGVTFLKTGMIILV